MFFVLMFEKIRRLQRHSSCGVESIINCRGRQDRKWNIVAAICSAIYPVSVQFFELE